MSSDGCFSALDREFTPILAQILTLEPNNDNHPDVQFLLNWLIQPERTVEEFEYIVRTLQENVGRIMVDLFNDYVYDYCDDGSILYVLKIAGEALAVRCPVLEGPWEKIAWGIFTLLGEWKYKEWGPASTTLSNWIIKVIGDSKLCPEPLLRVHMLRLYRYMIKIDDENQEKALDSLMFGFSSIKRHGDDFCFDEPATDFTEYLMLFTQEHTSYYDTDDSSDDEIGTDDYIYQYAQKIAVKLKQHKDEKEKLLLHDASSENGTSLKTLDPPIEIHSLIALLKYISDEACAKDGFFISKRRHVERASGALETLVKIFHVALQESDLFDATLDCVMNVMENSVIWVYDEKDDYEDGYVLNNELYCLVNINDMLEYFCDDTCVDFVDTAPLGIEIIKRYEDRICFMRQLFDEDFYRFYPNIQDLIYNSIY